MTKAQKVEQRVAIDCLRGWIKPGDTVYTILDHVSASGMTRHIRIVKPYVDAPSDGSERPIDFMHPNYAVSKALGLRQAKRDGLIMGGCGMDMGFALVYDLSHKLYPEYDCTGERCPSADHSNNWRGPRGESVRHKDGYAVSQRWL